MSLGEGEVYLLALGGDWARRHLFCIWRISNTKYAPCSASMRRAMTASMAQVAVVQVVIGLTPKNGRKVVCVRLFQRKNEATG